MSTPVDTVATQILHSELGEVRDELRRIDAKAGHLLVVATLAATITGLGTGALPLNLPPVVGAGFFLAALPWAIAVLQLALVIRPMTVPSTLESPTTMDGWLRHRWRVLSQVVEAKYTRVRRAVDLLLASLTITTASAVYWYLTRLAP